MNWFNVLKADIKFEFNPDGGAYGQYNRRTNEITINLSAFGQEQSKRGIAPQQLEAVFEMASDDIKDIISNETNFIEQLGFFVFKSLGDYDNVVTGTVTRIVDYLVNEYIAAISENPSNSPDEAMKNAFDQTIGAMKTELAELVHLFDSQLGHEVTDDQKGEVVMTLMMGVPHGWEFQEHLLPIFNQYFKNIDKVIFDAYKQGMSYREKGERTVIQGEEPHLSERGTQIAPELFRRIIGRDR